MSDLYDYEKEVWRDKRKRVIVLKSQKLEAQAYERLVRLAIIFGVFKKMSEKCYRCRTDLCSTVEVKDDECTCCKKNHKG